jgi:8-oxo-dGTP pyrophosphatase MutT (NUDIX family)
MAEDPKHHGVGVLFVDPLRGLYLLQQKDAHYLPCPYGFSLFGGAVEPGETPEQAAYREVGEELNPNLAAEAFRSAPSAVFAGELTEGGQSWHMTVLEQRVDSGFFDRLASSPVREGRGSVVVERSALRSLKWIWRLDRALEAYLRLGGAAELCPIKRGGLWGYADASWQVVIAPKFEGADRFDGDVACAKQGKRWGLIDRTGAWVAEPRFDRVWTPWSEDYVGASIDGKWGAINRRGHFIIKPQFDEIMPFRCGFAPVRKGERWGMVDRFRQYLLPLEYDSISPFGNDGLAEVRQGDRVGHVDVQGRFVWPLEG